MANGVLFLLVEAGFDFDVATPTGKPSILEECSSPRKDEAVPGFIRDNQTKFEQPVSLAKLVAEGGLREAYPYAAVFLPRGHGTMVGLPQDKDVGELIQWIARSDRYLVTVCHGPAAMLAAAETGDSPYPYAGYKMCAFPDKMDRQSPLIGYLPGQLPWFKCEQLAQQGMQIINDGVGGETHVDRKFCSGDSPKACDELGKTIARAMLDEFEG